jgi:very-short-patch-repair endonuclease
VVHLSVPGAKRTGRRGIRFHRFTTLAAGDVGRRARLPVTSPARTLLDLACVVSGDRLTRLYNDARIGRLIQDPDLADLLERTHGLPGAPALRLLYAHGRPGPTRSVAEHHFLRLVRTARLPMPLVNRQVEGMEVDFLWPDRDLVVEVDGYAFHSSPIAFERDRSRDAKLVAAGLTVLRLTWNQVTNEEAATASRLAAALAV